MMTPSEKLKLQTTWRGFLESDHLSRISAQFQDVADTSPEMQQALTEFSVGISRLDDVVNYLTHNWSNKDDA